MSEPFSSDDIASMSDDGTPSNVKDEDGGSPSHRGRSTTGQNSEKVCRPNSGQGHFEGLLLTLTPKYAMSVDPEDKEGRKREVRIVQQLLHTLPITHMISKC
jgi:hypothetical protein